MAECSMGPRTFWYFGCFLTIWAFLSKQLIGHLQFTQNYEIMIQWRKIISFDFHHVPTLSIGVKAILRRFITRLLSSIRIISNNSIAILRSESKHILVFFSECYVSFERNVNHYPKMVSISISKGLQITEPIPKTLILINIPLKQKKIKCKSSTPCNTELGSFTFQLHSRVAARF